MKKSGKEHYYMLIKAQKALAQIGLSPLGALCLLLLALLPLLPPFNQ